MSQRIYCVPCNAICPFLEPAKQATWMEEHRIQKHPPGRELEPMVKEAYFAPVPSSWG